MGSEPGSVCPVRCGCRFSESPGSAGCCGSVDQCGWLGGSVSGKRILCLAAGGGRHSVLFASDDAIVTVVDLNIVGVASTHSEKSLGIRFQKSIIGALCSTVVLPDHPKSSESSLAWRICEADLRPAGQGLLCKPRPTETGAL